MKTCLFAPCYLDGKDPGGTPRLERLMRYLTYYDRIRDELGFNWIFLSDDGSSVMDRMKLSDRSNVGYTMIPHSKLHRQGGITNGCDYPYVWQALYDLKIPMELGYEKIITIDTDCFLLSKRLAAHVKRLSTGWEAFHISKYNFASAEFHIICKDAFPHFLRYCRTPFMERNGQKMEEVLPFSKVNRDFNVDRWGETKELQRPDMDFYSNSYGDAPMRFEGKDWEL